MTNNDILRSIRYMLDLSNQRLVDICQLAEHETTVEDINTYLKPEEDEAYVACPDAVMLDFLDGLVIYKRGRKETAAGVKTEQDAESAPTELSKVEARALTLRMNNNLVLKKLRVAFELKEEDMHAIFASAQHEISKPELSALFRKKGHGNYRACGDQILRYFLKGLTMRLRQD